MGEEEGGGGGEGESMHLVWSAFRVFVALLLYSIQLNSTQLNLIRLSQPNSV